MTAEYSPLQPESQNQFAASGLDPAEFFETGSIPGVTPQPPGEGRVPSLKLPPGGQLSFEARTVQTEFAFITALVTSSVTSDFAEIKLRACIKIGDLSRELEKNERARTDLHHTGDAQTKTETLEAAGINLRTAERYEELTGCISVLMNSRSPLNKRDPTRAEWRKELATFVDRPATFPFSKN